MVASQLTVVMFVTLCCMSSGFSPSLQGQSPVVETGAEQVANNATLRHLLFSDATGIITNPTGVLNNLTHIVDAVHSDGQAKLSAVFGPEHGFRGDHQDGQGGKDKYFDNRTGLPVYSLYGKTGDSLQAIINESMVTTVAYDIQDVGTRFYTYIWTLYDVMSVLQGTKVKNIVILDRPNPLGGNVVRGPLMQPEFSSFIGRCCITLRHGMTVGELAALFMDHLGLKGIELTVVAMKGWNRAMLYPSTGLTFVSPSPNMPTFDTAVVYPGLGMIEGTNLSEGRGTTTPFQRMGAAFFTWHYAETIRDKASHNKELAGAIALETYFIPMFSKFVGNVTAGVEVVVRDNNAFNSLAWGLTLVQTALELYPEAQFLNASFDIHMGNNYTREALRNGTTIQQLLDWYSADEQSFRQSRTPFLIYS
eukprot:m.70775 g.70775  ORF g.70775 m.70775 type:complete len:420 (-) comp12268_c1_seq3:365-1624(-)